MSSNTDTGVSLHDFGIIKPRTWDVHLRVTPQADGTVSLGLGWGGESITINLTPEEVDHTVGLLLRASQLQAA